MIVCIIISIFISMIIFSGALYYLSEGNVSEMKKAVFDVPGFCALFLVIVISVINGALVYNTINDAKSPIIPTETTTTIQK